MRCTPLPAGLGACLTLRSARAVSVVGRSIFHSSWSIPPSELAAVCRSEGRGSLCTIFASEPVQVLSNTQLQADEVHCIRYHAVLPEGLPPSLNGTAVKHLYSIVVTLKLGSTP